MPQAIKGNSDFWTVSVQLDFNTEKPSKNIKGIKKNYY